MSKISYLEYLACKPETLRYFEVSYLRWEMNGMPDVDGPVKQALICLNRIPGLTTVESCASHQESESCNNEQPRYYIKCAANKHGVHQLTRILDLLYGVLGRFVMPCAPSITMAAVVRLTSGLEFDAFGSKDGSVKPWSSTTLELYLDDNTAHIAQLAVEHVLRVFVNERFYLRGLSTYNDQAIVDKAYTALTSFIASQ